MSTKLKSILNNLLKTKERQKHNDFDTLRSLRKKIMIKLLMKLPSWLLIKLSGKKQVEIGDRKLHPPFQFLLKLTEDLVTDFATLTADQFRAAFVEQSKIRPKMPTGIKWKDHVIDVSNGKISIREYYSKKIKGNCPSLVYFHGGGWVIGDVETHHQLTAYICDQLDAKVFSVDYRLSPEYKYPIPLNDCNEAFDWVYNNSASLGLDKDRIAAGGDSAGGNLTASLCLKRKKENQPLPKAQLLLYPVTDLQLIKDSIDECAEGFFLTKAAMEWFRKHYLNSLDERTDPLVSPLLAEDLSNLPPAVICTAGFDPLRDEGNEYAKKLKSSDNRVYLQENQGYIHGFANMGYVPGVTKVLNEIFLELKEMME